MKFLGKSISGPFTIPSGVVTTHVSAIRRVAAEIPEIGVITTKSIGPAYREGNREPVLAQYAPGCFMNAVGLANPGAVAFVKELEKIRLPRDRFLLISIFGKDMVEFRDIARTIAPFADGIELNLSCPHASGYGMAIGQDKQLVFEIVKEVKSAVSIPVVPKLTPNAVNIEEIAGAAKDAGADAICAVNTVGPGYYTVDGHPVLTNVKGGMSGKGILPIGLDCVKRIAVSVDLPIVACGGISGADDVRAYQDAGASIFGIGSALAGLRDMEMKRYFRALGRDLSAQTDHAEALLKTGVDMSYRKYTVAENRKPAHDLAIVRFDGAIDIEPGQFVFVWIPGLGEKPFSVLDDDPLTLAVRKAGLFTNRISTLGKGDQVYFRGPYGRPAIPPDGAQIVLVSGGCGLAALYPIARRCKKTKAFIGAVDKEHLFYIDQLKQYADVYTATDDGSAGRHGVVTDLLQIELERRPPASPTIFYNCGPKPMIDAAVQIEAAYAPPEAIFNSVDYITRCGVGICGSCASPDGRRSCVDGPFMEC